jgi:hypothetical protein
VKGWTPNDQDVKFACTARIDDFVLGGSSSLAVDRAVAEQLLAAVPEHPRSCRITGSSFGGPWV